MTSGNDNKRAGSRRGGGRRHIDQNREHSATAGELDAAEQLSGLGREWRGVRALRVWCASSHHGANADGKGHRSHCDSCHRCCPHWFRRQGLALDASSEVLSYPRELELQSCRKVENAPLREYSTSRKTSHRLALRRQRASKPCKPPDTKMVGLIYGSGDASIALRSTSIRGSSG